MNNKPNNNANNASLNKAIKQLNDALPVIKKQANSLSNNDPDKVYWVASANFLTEHLPIIKNHKNTKTSTNYVNRVNTFVKSRKNLSNGKTNNKANNTENNTKKNNNNAVPAAAPAARKRWRSWW